MVMIPYKPSDHGNQQCLCQQACCGCRLVGVHDQYARHVVRFAVHLFFELASTLVIVNNTGSTEHIWRSDMDRC